MRINQSKSSITILWTEPEPNGCPVTGFAILRDNGNDGDINVVVDSALVSNKPSLRQYLVASLTALGQEYKIKVRAFNNAGFSDS